MITSPQGLRADEEFDAALTYLASLTMRLSRVEQGEVAGLVRELIFKRRRWETHIGA
jgi:hypothetical protein